MFKQSCKLISVDLPGCLEESQRFLELKISNKFSRATPCVIKTPMEEQQALHWHEHERERHHHSVVGAFGG